MTTRFRLLGAGTVAVLAALPAFAQVQRPDSPPPDRTEIVTGLPEPTTDDLVTADDPDRLLQLMRSLGYNVTLGTDGVGDPLLYGRMSRSLYDLFFYGCTNHLNCAFLHFVAYVDLPDGTDPAIVERWNEERLWGTATIDDDGNAQIAVSYNLFGGVSEANFADTLDWFRVAVETFEQEVGD